MRFKKIEPAHVEERTIDDGTVCDGCGKPADVGGFWERNDVTIGALLGDVYPEADHRTAYDLDVCAECFTTKVVPALASVGLRFRLRDADDDDRAFRTP